MFNVSTRLRYGLRALIYLSEKETDKTVNLHQIADSEGISRKYLENIFKLLKKSKIIRSIRGREGGYALIRDPGEITMYEIANAIEGNIILLDCTEDDNFCTRSSICGIRDFWVDYQKYIIDYLDGMTFNDFLEKYVRKSNEKYLP